MVSFFSIGSSPSELFLGRTLHCSLDLLKPSQHDLVEEHQKRCHHRSKRNVLFELGQSVLARVFRKGLIRWERGHVAKILGAWMLLVRLQDGTSIKAIHQGKAFLTFLARFPLCLLR